jgi:branched-chain amino acid transport system permease protein
VSDRQRRTWAVAAATVAVFAAVPAMLSAVGQSYLFRLADLSMIFIILAASLNLVTGTAGLVSLGHAAFYAVGAYTAGILAARYGLGLEATLPASALVAGVLAAAVAVPAIRLVRIFFTVATLSVGEIINITLLNWDGLTNGPMGLRGVPQLRILGWDLGGRLATYYTVAATMAAIIWVLHRLTHSFYGNALRAMREDDQSTGAMGLNVARLKIGAFAISGALAGVAGCLLAHVTGYISPDMFQLDQSILILTMVVVGGLGSLPGAVVGACILILAPELARGAGHFRMVAVGAVLFLSILLMPKGLLPEAAALRFARGGLLRREHRPVE